MPPETFVLLVVAGIGTGLVGYLTGLASLVSYPALLAAGLPPIAANVTNTVSLVGVGVGSSVQAARPLFAGAGRGMAHQSLVALLGGGAGAVLLLSGGEDAFTALVPWLVLVASGTVLLAPRLRRLADGRERPALYLLCLFLVCVYGGYFGAGAGVLFLAITLIGTAETFARSMMIKSFLLGLTNLVSAVLFAFLAPVHWVAALALGLGCLVGGVLGPVVQGWLHEGALRWAIAVCGVGLAVWLWRG